MKKLIKGTLIVSGIFALGAAVGYRIAYKVLGKRDFDDVQYIKTPNDHIIIKVEEDDNLNTFNGDDIDVNIPEQSEENVSRTVDGSFLDAIEDDDPFNNI